MNTGTLNVCLHFSSNRYIRAEIIRRRRRRRRLCNLSCMSAAALLQELQVRISLRAGCSSLGFVACCVGSGLCDELIIRSEESYRLCA